jgi:hypothetical protein
MFPLAATQINPDLGGIPVGVHPTQLGMPIPPLPPGPPANAFDNAILTALRPQFKTTSWNFVPVTSVLAGPIVTLPRMALGVGVLRNVNDVDNIKNDVLYYQSWNGSFSTIKAPYRPGLAENRFRLLSYGSIFLLISDMSRRAVAGDGRSSRAIIELRDESCWFTSSGNKIVSFANQQPAFWQVVNNISDIAERQKPWYIVLGQSDTGYPIVLSAKGRDPVAEPFDPFDGKQLWRYYDWGSCKCNDNP